MDLLSYSFLFSIFVVITAASASDLGVANFREPPANQAGEPGDDVIVVCQVDDGIRDEFEIREFITDHVSGTRIFDSSNNVVTHPDKYEVGGKYELKIKHLKFTDGGRYICSLFNNDRHENFYIMVVEKPQISLSRSSINDGDDVTVTCTARYGAHAGYEHEDPHPGEGEHVPTVQLNVGGVPLDQVEVTHSQDAPGQLPFTLSATVTYRARKSDHNNNMTCTLSSYNRQFSAAHKLLINHEAANVDFSPAYQTTFSVGDNITCRGDGYPEPAVTWTDVATGEVIPVMGEEGVLVLTEDMVGDSKELRCSVEREGGMGSLHKSTVINIVKPQSGESSGADGKTFHTCINSLLHLLVLALIAAILHV